MLCCAQCCVGVGFGDLRQLPPVRATAIYKQPKQSIAGPMLWRQLKFYPLRFHLAPFATSSAQIFRSREIYSRMPVILSGDFNTDFKKEESAPLTEYLREVFNLEMKNDRNIPTTRYGTTIDAVFTRYIEKIECKSLFTYFSYHKILVTFIDCETQGEDEVIDRIIEVQNDSMI